MQQFVHTLLIRVKLQGGLVRDRLRVSIQVIGRVYVGKSWVECIWVRSYWIKPFLVSSVGWVGATQVGSSPINAYSSASWVWVGSFRLDFGSILGRHKSSSKQLCAKQVGIGWTWVGASRVRMYLVSSSRNRVELKWFIICLSSFFSNHYRY